MKRTNPHMFSIYCSFLVSTGFQIFFPEKPFKFKQNIFQFAWISRKNKKYSHTNNFYKIQNKIYKKRFIFK